MKWMTKPRIIGIILLVIALLVYFIGRQGAIPVAIAGIIIIIAPAKHANKMFDLYIENFSKWKTIIITALYEALYWLVIFGSAYFFQYLVQSKMAVSQGAALTREQMMNPELVTQGTAALKEFVTFLFVGGALLVIFSCIIYSISRAFIWATITNQKTNKKYLLKFTLLNIAWWAIWLPLYIILNVGLKNDPRVKESMVVLLLFGYYFSPIVHTIYTKKHLIGQSIGNGIAWGISKVHRFIIPYILIFVTYVILYQLFRLVETTAWAKAVSILFIIIFIAWARTYLYEVIKEFK